MSLSLYFFALNPSSEVLAAVIGASKGIEAIRHRVPCSCVMIQPCHRARPGDGLPVIGLPRNSRVSTERGSGWRGFRRSVQGEFCVHPTQTLGEPIQVSGLYRDWHALTINSGQ